VAIEKVYALNDYQIATDCAHERAEIIVAQWDAKRFGMNNVREPSMGRDDSTRLHLATSETSAATTNLLKRLRARR
jgi:hypothetical protein